MKKSKHTPFPWDRRGYRFYEHGSERKVILEVKLTWRSSEEADANADLIEKALNAFGATLSTADRGSPRERS